MSQYKLFEDHGNIMYVKLHVSEDPFNIDINVSDEFASKVMTFTSNEKSEFFRITHELNFMTYDDLSQAFPYIFEEMSQISAFNAENQSFKIKEGNLEISHKSFKYLIPLQEINDSSFKLSILRDLHIQLSQFSKISFNILKLSNRDIETKNKIIRELSEVIYHRRNLDMDSSIDVLRTSEIRNMFNKHTRYRLDSDLAYIYNKVAMNKDTVLKNTYLFNDSEASSIIRIMNSIAGEEETKIKTSDDEKITSKKQKH